MQVTMLAVHLRKMPLASGWFPGAGVEQGGQLGVCASSRQK